MILGQRKVPELLEERKRERRRGRDTSIPRNLLGLLGLGLGLGWWKENPSSGMMMGGDSVMREEIFCLFFFWSVWQRMKAVLLGNYLSEKNKIRYPPIHYFILCSKHINFPDLDHIHYWVSIIKYSRHIILLL